MAGINQTRAILAIRLALNDPFARQTLP